VDESQQLNGARGNSDYVTASTRTPMATVHKFMRFRISIQNTQEK
jgi:hypothetical protein